MRWEKLIVPTFESEAEEAVWWEKHRAVVEADLRAAMREGKAVSLEDVLAGRRGKRRTDDPDADTFLSTG